MPVNKEIYMCVYCDQRIINGTSCVPCNEYDGAVTLAEWQQLQREFPRKKVGA